MVRARGIVRSNGSDGSDNPSDEGAMMDEQLPWLESADDAFDEESGINRLWLLLAAAVFLLVLVGTVWFFYSGSGDGQKQLASGEVELIAAPEGPFKQRPTGQEGDEAIGSGDVVSSIAVGEPLDQPQLAQSDSTQMLDPSSVFGQPQGGELNVPGTSTQAADEAAQLDTALPAPPPARTSSATPKPQPVPAPVPLPVPQPKPAAAPAPAPAAASAASGRYLLQLGAFSSVERANSGWSQYSRQFNQLAGLSADIQSVAVNGKTLYRLRAARVSSRGQADQICSAIKAGGVPCIVVDR